MKALELRDIDTDELELRIAEFKEELFNLRFQLATGQLDNHARITQVKRDIARARTVLREREIETYYAATGRPAPGRTAAATSSRKARRAERKAAAENDQAAAASGDEEDK